MPLQREHLQFALLFLCVPLQYFVVQYSGTSESTRSYNISLIIKQIRDFRDSWFKIEPWIEWTKKLLVKITNPYYSG
jgi:hypothetical protein